MPIEDLLALVQKGFERRHGKPKSVDDKLQVEFGDEVAPATGLIVDNPLLEYVLDRRFLAYGRCYLTYGRKGNSKTSLFLNLATMFQQAGGYVVWIETEKAADLDYAAKQGVDLKRIIVPKVETLQEALSFAEEYIKNLPTAFPDGEVPHLICLDSIAGAIPEYETQDDLKVGETKVGEHARLMSGFYRRIIHPLAHEKAVFLAINQLKDKIGGMPTFGGEPLEAMIGGEAPRFHSSYQFKVSKLKEIFSEKGRDGAKRKVGSHHEIVCKRNKLGREGNTQKIAFDLYIDGGIDWWTPLVRKLKMEYPSLVGDKGGARVTWEVPNTEYSFVNDKGDTETGIIPTEPMKEAKLGQIIRYSNTAKDLIRDAFGIPALPPEEVIKEVELDNKKKRGRKKKIADEDDDIPLSKPE